MDRPEGRFDLVQAHPAQYLDWKKSGKTLRKWDAEVTAKGEVVTRDGPPGILYPVSDQPVGRLGRICTETVA
jgi:hypothetical protein